MTSRGINQVRLSQETGVTQSAISQYLKRDRSPRPEELERLAEFFGVSMDTMWRGEKPIQSNPSGPLIIGESPRNWGGPYYGTRSEAPVISWARAGGGGYYEDQGYDVPHVPVFCKDPNCYVLQIEGDSMEHLYSEGDLLVIAPNDEAKQGDLVVVKTKEDEVLFKKFEKIGSNFRLSSFNPKYPPLYYAPKEIRFAHPVHSVIKPLKGKFF